MAIPNSSKSIGQVEPLLRFQFELKGVRVVLWFEAGLLSRQPELHSHTDKPLKKRPKTTSVPKMR